MIDYEHIPHLVQEDDDGETLISVRPHLPSKAGVLLDVAEHDALVKDAARWRFAVAHLLEYDRTGQLARLDCDSEMTVGTSLIAIVDAGIEFYAERAKSEQKQEAA
jgi:hypothetical protein